VKFSPAAGNDNNGAPLPTSETQGDVPPDRSPGAARAQAQPVGPLCAPLVPTVERNVIQDARIQGRGVWIPGPLSAHSMCKIGASASPCHRTRSHKCRRRELKLIALLIRWPEFAAGTQVGQDRRIPSARLESRCTAVVRSSRQGVMVVESYPRSARRISLACNSMRVGLGFAAFQIASCTSSIWPEQDVTGFSSAAST